MGSDGHDVVFVPFGGKAPDPEAFLARVLEGWERQQRARDFAVATIRTRRQVVMALMDFSANSRAPYLGDHGVLRVRWGKPHRGSAKKVRSVLTVWDWSAQMMAHWISQGLPRYGDPVSDVFPTSAGAIVTESHLISRLHGLIDELGFPPGLDLHSFRRSDATHLITGEGYDVTFVQLQLGHEHAATTTTYTLPSPDYQRRALERAHNQTLKAALSRPGRSTDE